MVGGVGVGEEAKGIPEAKGGLGTDLGLEAHLHGGRLGHARRRGEGGGRAEGEEDGGAVKVGSGRRKRAS
jgi:hypothetical protein